MSDWITVALVCVCVCVGVKVGYSLLLGHVANPLTLAWILLTDPFSSNKHTSPWRWRPPGLGYRCQSARAARRSFHIVATLKQPPSSSSRHPTDVFFSGLSPNSVLVTTVIIIVVVVAVVSVAEKGLSSVESELRRKPSDAPRDVSALRTTRIVLTKTAAAVTPHRHKSHSGHVPAITPQGESDMKTITERVCAACCPTVYSRSFI